MTADDFAEKNGFTKVVTVAGEVSYMDPNGSWTLGLNGCKTYFGPVGLKPYEQRSHEDDECADAFVLGLMMSIVNLQRNC